MIRSWTRCVSHCMYSLERQRHVLDYLNLWLTYLQSDPWQQLNTIQITTRSSLILNAFESAVYKYQPFQFSLDVLMGFGENQASGTSTNRWCDINMCVTAADIKSLAYGRCAGLGSIHELNLNWLSIQFSMNWNWIERFWIGIELELKAWTD